MGALKLSYYHKVEEGHQVVPIFNLYPLEQQHAALKNRVNCSPFGVTLHGRDLSLSTTGNKPYAYGFNGMIKDDEIKGEGNSYDFGARMLDPRIGRWLTIDPLCGKQPSQSPYKSMLNNPIVFKDPDGQYEYLTLVIDDQRSGHKIVIKYPKAVSTKIMTDGTGSTDVHSNNYYDFETVITIKIDQTGKYTASLSYNFIYENGLRDFDLAWGTANEKAKYHTKAKPDGNSWGVLTTLEGPGEIRKGGAVVTTKEGGASPTKDISKTKVDEIKSDELLLLADKMKGVKSASDLVKDPTFKRIVERIEEAKGKLESVKEVHDDYYPEKEEVKTPSVKRNDTIWTEDGGYEVYGPNAKSKPTVDKNNNDLNRQKYYLKNGKP